MLLFQEVRARFIVHCKIAMKIRMLGEAWPCGKIARGQIGYSQLGASSRLCKIEQRPGGAMIDRIQQKRIAPGVSMLGILAVCLVFWVAVAAMVLSW